MSRTHHGQAKQKNQLEGPLSRQKLGLFSEIELSLLHKTHPCSPELSQRFQLIYFTQKYMQSIAKFLYIIFISFIFCATTLSKRNSHLTEIFFWQLCDGAVPTLLTMAICGPSPTPKFALIGLQICTQVASGRPIEYTKNQHDRPCCSALAIPFC